MGPLARALRERERTLILHVPCSWSSCPESVALPFDLIAGPHTEVVTEYTITVGDAVYRRDVATLLHDSYQAGFETYHHRVPEEKRQSALSNWIEIHAEGLLASPYDLWMVQDAPPVNPPSRTSRTSRKRWLKSSRLRCTAIALMVRASGCSKSLTVLTFMSTHMSPPPALCTPG